MTMSEDGASTFGTCVFAVLATVYLLNAVLCSYNVYHLFSYLWTRGRKSKGGDLPRMQDCEGANVKSITENGSLSPFVARMNDESKLTQATTDMDSSEDASEEGGLPWTPDPTVDYPMVTIQATVYNELSCIEGLIKNLSKMQWPADRLQIQILDDSTLQQAVDLVDSVIEDLEAKGCLHNFEHRQRDNRIGYKAGNLLHHFDSIQGEFTAIFDADFLPYPDFLLKTIPHFYNGKGEVQEDIGLVQTTWDHFNQTDNLLTQAQGLMQNFAFIVQQNVRYRCTEFIPFNGTAGVWRTEAIAKSGNWNYDTVTEDLDLACRAKLQGYKFKYLEHVSVPSELPPTIMAYKRQQRRWTQGHMQVGRKVIGAVWRSDFPTKLKIELTHVTLHKVDWFPACIGLLATPLLGFVHLSAAQLMIISIPGLYVLAIWTVLLSLTLWDKKFTHPQDGPRLDRLFVIPCFILLHTGMTLWQVVSAIEGLIQNDIPFAATPKKGKSSPVDEDAMERQAQMDDDDIELVENQATGDNEYKEWNYDGWNHAGISSKVKRRPPGKLSKTFPEWAHFLEFLLALYFFFVGFFFDGNKLFALPFMILSTGFFWVAIPGIRGSLRKTCLSSKKPKKTVPSAKEQDPSTSSACLAEDAPKVADADYEC